MKLVNRTLLPVGLLICLIALCSIAVNQPTIPLRNQPALADTTRLDAETGLPIDNNLVLVRAHCTGCHSTKLIQQNRFTRDGWKQKIRWMQRTQKLWELGEAEPAILDYLTKHYGPEDKRFDGRRLPLTGVKWRQ